MKTENLFIAEARAALHCDALFAQQVTDADRLEGVAGLMERIAADCADRLRARTGFPMSAQSLTAPDGTALAEAGPAQPAHAHEIVLTLSQKRATIRLSILPDGLEDAVTHLFGGPIEGQDAPASHADRAPHFSARLMQRRVAQSLSASVTALLAPLGITCRPAEGPVSEKRERGAGENRIAADLTIGGLGQRPLRARIRLCRNAFAALTDALDRGATGSRAAGDPSAGPYAEIELPLRAVLAESRLPLSRIAALSPGDFLPLPVRRRVPLVCGETVIAWGTVGEMDDSAALKIVPFETTGDNP